MIGCWPENTTNLRLGHLEQGAAMAFTTKIAIQIASGRRIGRALLLASAMSLGGCAAIDHFGPRTVQVNQETSNAKSKAVLVNILRAAHGLPLQFTDVTTVTGSGSLDASLEI